MGVLMQDRAGHVIILMCKLTADRADGGGATWVLRTQAGTVLLTFKLPRQKDYAYTQVSFLP